MANGRFLSVSIADDSRLNSLSVIAELLFLKTIPHLDRDGMITGKAGALWGRVCPEREELMTEMQKAIDEWVKAGLVVRFLTNEGPVLFFPGFLKNNKLAHYDRERPSRFQPPPGYYSTKTGLVLLGKEPPVKKPKKAKEAQVTSSSNGNPDEVLESVLESVLDFPLQEQEEVEVKVEVEVKDQVKEAATQRATLADEVIFDFQAQPTAATKLKVLTPQQAMYAAICDALGWDYHVIAEREKVRVAQAVKILSKAEPAYTVEDIRRFMVEIWFHDWRWEKFQQYPTLEQLRQDIGKTRSMVPSAAPPPAAKGINSFNRLAASIGMGS